MTSQTAPANGIGTPRVTILLATYNGAPYLNAQLASYAAQKDVDWDLWVSDDGSQDETQAIIAAFQKQQAGRHDIRVLTGPGRGSAANFMHLLTHPDLPTDRPIALSDQDDVWHPGKLARALSVLSNLAPLTLYGAQSIHTDADLTPIGQSRMPTRAPSFCNALVQNIVSGHSTVMPPAVVELVRQAGVPADIPYHDWWLYQLVTGAGGHVHIDDARTIDYRQHRQNVMGAHAGLRASLVRIGQVLGHSYGDWVATNMQALGRVRTLLTPENQSVLDAINGAPKGLLRAAALSRLGIYRQSRAGTASLYAAAALGRV